MALRCFGKGDQGCPSTLGEFEILIIFYKNEMVTCVFKNRVLKTKSKFSCTMMRIIEMIIYEGHPSGLLVLYDFLGQN